MADEEPAEDEQVEERAVVRQQQDGSALRNAVETLESVDLDAPGDEQTDQRRDHPALPDPGRPGAAALVQEPHHPEGEPLPEVEGGERRLVAHFRTRGPAWR